MDFEKRKDVIYSSAFNSLRFLMLSSLEKSDQITDMLCKEFADVELPKLDVKPHDFFNAFIDILIDLRDRFPEEKNRATSSKLNRTSTENNKSDSKQIKSWFLKSPIRVNDRSTQTANRWIDQDSKHIYCFKDLPRALQKSKVQFRTIMGLQIKRENEEAAYADRSEFTLESNDRHGKKEAFQSSSREWIPVIDLDEEKRKFDRTISTPSSSNNLEKSFERFLKSTLDTSRTRIQPKREAKVAHIKMESENNFKRANPKKIKIEQNEEDEFVDIAYRLDTLSSKYAIDWSDVNPLIHDYIKKNAKTVAASREFKRLHTRIEQILGREIKISQLCRRIVYVKTNKNRQLSRTFNVYDWTNERVQSLISEHLRRLHTKNPMRLADLCNRMSEVFGKNVLPSTVHRKLKKIKTEFDNETDIQ